MRRSTILFVVLGLWLSIMTVLVSTSKATGVNDPLIVSAGDIQQGNPGGNSIGTADYIVSIKPELQYVLPLGDTQYHEPETSAATYQDFVNYYDKTWGQFKNISKPVIGNHECGYSGLDTNTNWCSKTDADGYYRYFGSPRYYAYNVGNWRIYALNSEIKHTTQSLQYAWLKNDLTQNVGSGGKCILAYWHRPRWSSGEHGSNPRYQPFWDLLWTYRADVILNGHDHDYERFARQSPAGNFNTFGMREFVVGTGGKSERWMGSTPAAHSQVYHSGYGVLRMRLHNDAYNWKFISTDGTGWTDYGRTKCNWARLP